MNITHPAFTSSIYWALGSGVYLNVRSALNADVRSIVYTSVYQTLSWDVHSEVAEVVDLAICEEEL